MLFAICSGLGHHDCTFTLVVCWFDLVVLTCPGSTETQRRTFHLWYILNAVTKDTVSVDCSAGLWLGALFLTNFKWNFKKRIFFTLAFEKLGYRKQYMLVLSLDREHKVPWIVHGSLNAFQQKKSWHFKFIANRTEELTKFFTQLKCSHEAAINYISYVSRL